MKPTKQKRFGWLALIVAAVVALGIGGALGGAGNGTTTARPAPTVTVTETAEVPAAEEPEPTATEPEPEPEPEPKPTPTKKAARVKAENVTSRQWAKVVKSPDDFIGERYIIYGQVSQFDAATGEDAFLADTAHKNTTEYGYFDGENTMLSGDVDDLSDVVEDDVFRAAVTVLGSYSYDTQIGGNTTVPHLQVDSIKVIGNNS